MLRLARAVVVVALIVAGVSANAGGFTEVWIWYFTDAAMTNEVGWYNDTCDNVIRRGGVEATYRWRDITSCSTGTTSTTCSYWDGSSWQPMTCPW